MRNREKHRDKFLRGFKVENFKDFRKEFEKFLRKDDSPWCTRQGAKEVIDDLTDKEFKAVTSVLGHLFLMEEKFPTEEDNQRFIEDIGKFLRGKTIKQVSRIGLPPEYFPSIQFEDGTFFVAGSAVHIPGAMRYLWGKEEQEPPS